MSASLFFKECKAVLKSVIYIAFIGVVVLFYVQQFNDEAGKDILQASNMQESSEHKKDNPLIPPVIGLESYGTKPAEIPEQIMPNTISSLVREWEFNNYVTYPIGFYKNVKLNNEMQSEIAEIIKEITGSNPDELNNLIAAKMAEITDTSFYVENSINYSEVVPIVVDYQLFKEKMERVDKLLGGGSHYAESSYKKRGSAPVTYEEKLAEYNAFINEDKITGAYARLFCDYMGITIALFSVFVPVAFLIRDKRAKVNELIYSHDISSAKIIFTRYAAVVVMTIVPIFLISLIPTVKLTIFATENGLPVDIFSFTKYILGWLLPTVMITTSVAFFFTILTGTPVAIAVQFLWSYISLLTGTLEGGNYGANIIVRHNYLGNLQVYKDNIGQLAVNRILYAVFALVLAVAAVFIYDMKRRGMLDVDGKLDKIFRNRKGAN